MTTDADKDLIYYGWEWEYGTEPEWWGPWPSGQRVEATHVWQKKGTYNIKVKARDKFEGYSDWSLPLEVTMPVYYGQGCPQGTQITMAYTGTPETKNIEDIVVGNYIASYDPIYQAVTNAEVIAVYEFTVDLPEYNLIFNYNLEVTPRHTLYINGIGWMEANDTELGYYMLENPPGTQEINQVPILSKAEKPSIIKIYDLVIQPLGGKACGYWTDDLVIQRSGEVCGYWANSMLVGGYN